MKKISTLAVILLVTINIAFAGVTTNNNFKKDLTTFTNTYIKLKESFVQANSKDINSIAAQMIEDVEEVSMDGLSNQEMKQWHNSIFAIKANLGDILKSDNITDQRKAFAKLSAELIKSLKAFDTSNNFYEINCPMFEGGSNWIDNTKTITNPFYGNDMLTCGSVVRTL